MATHERRLVVCPPLCFVFTKLGKVNGSKIIKVLIDAFLPTEISAAKNILTRDAEDIKVDKTLPRMAAHRDTDLQQRTLKDATDIEMLASTLDRRHLLDKLPRYVTDNTDSTPTMKLEEGELSYFMTKIDKFEDTILCLQETVNKLYAIIHGLMSESDKQAAGLCSTEHRPEQRPIQNQAPMEIMNEARRAARDNSTATPTTAKKVVSRRWSSSRPSTSSAVDSHAADTESDVPASADDDFTLVENRKSSKRRRVASDQHQTATRRNGVNSQPAQGVPTKTFSTVAATNSATQPKTLPTRKPLMVGRHHSPAASNTSSNKLVAAISHYLVRRCSAWTMSVLLLLMKSSSRM